MKSLTKSLQNVYDKLSNITSKCQVYVISRTLMVRLDFELFV